MRTIALMCLAALVSVGGNPAQADTPGCVSRHEFNRVVKGMTMTRAHRIFDIEGVVTGLGTPNELRYYGTCTGRGMVQVVFSPRDRVVSKDARFF
ncbi:hypothetical protein [Nocardioides sp. P5_E3]